MAQSVEESLCVYLKTSKFSIQLDESTLPRNETLLLAYVRFIKDEKICEKLLFAKTLQTDPKGESIFHILDKFFKEKIIPLINILSVATDGAPSMTGRHKLGFCCTFETINTECNCCTLRHLKNLSKNLS